MKNYLILFMISTLAFAACVPQRKYLDMQKTYESALKDKADCSNQLFQARDSLSAYMTENNKMKEDIKNLQADTSLMGSSNRKLNGLYIQINTAYDKLLEKQKELESENKITRNELSTQLLETQKKLNDKEVELNNKETSLKKLENELSITQQNLNEREKRVKELSDVLNKKDSAVNMLKNSISNALFGFKDQGISVNIKNGKVYVSVEEKLLFESGKYTVNTNGRNALLELAKALNAQKDVTIMVEGHTDNVPYKGSGTIKDNLDLSVLRATEVARILTKDGGVLPTRVIAAGRGDTQPVASNSSPEGRSKNRRTEIILTPELGELFKILGQE